MPTYTFRNKRGKIKEYTMSIKEYDQFKEDHPELQRVIEAPALSFHAKGFNSLTDLAVKKDPGWGEVLSKIGQQNPHSEINSNYTRNKTSKTIKAENIVEKHAKIQAKQAARKR